MDKKPNINTAARERACMILSTIEFVCAENRCEEVASVYRYFGLNPSIAGPMEFNSKGRVAGIDRISDSGKKTNKGVRLYMNTFNLLRHMRNITRPISSLPVCIRLTLPRYDITVAENNPAELMFFLGEKEKMLKGKFDEVNKTIIANRKRINNARENILKKVEVVNDFLGTGNKKVSSADFKAYITGLSVANHNLKKRAKNIYTKYMKMKELQNIILQSYIGEDNFDSFYKVYCKVCKQHRKNEN